MDGLTCFRGLNELKILLRLGCEFKVRLECLRSVWHIYNSFRPGNDVKDQMLSKPDLFGI